MWKRQTKVVLAVFFLAVIIIIIGFMCLRLRGSVTVTPSQTKLSVGEVKSYRQDDATWAEDTLGDSRFTMEFSGCLVTCIASAVSMEKGSEMTPKALNALFSENHVYDSEGNIQWAEVEKIQGYSVSVLQKVSEAEIARCLALGHYPIVRVRMYGLGNFHYVLIVGVEDGDYICMDPLADELTKLSRYQNRVYAMRVVSVEKTILDGRKQQ